MCFDDGRYVFHTAVTNLHCVAVEDFGKTQLLRETLLDQLQEKFSDRSFEILTVRWIEPNHLPGALFSSRRSSLRSYDRRGR